MKCEGQLRHRFWGQYSCVVGLLFKSHEDAEKALPLLPGFDFGDNPKTVLYRVASGRKDDDPYDARTEVDEVRDLIERFRVYEPGDHRGPIDGTPFSIDYGPGFHCDFGPALTQLQLPL